MNHSTHNTSRAAITPTTMPTIAPADSPPLPPPELLEPEVGAGAPRVPFEDDEDDDDELERAAAEVIAAMPVELDVDVGVTTAAELELPAETRTVAVEAEVVDVAAEMGVELAPEAEAEVVEVAVAMGVELEAAVGVLAAELDEVAGAILVVDEEAGVEVAAEEGVAAEVGLTTTEPVDELDEATGARVEEAAPADEDREVEDEAVEEDEGTLQAHGPVIGQHRAPTPHGLTVTPHALATADKSSKLIALFHTSLYFTPPAAHCVP